MLASIFLSFFFLFQTPTVVTPTPAPSPKPSETPQVKEEPPVVTKHVLRVGGKTLNYTTTTGFMPIKNERTGDVEARIFFMAYTLDNPPANRPLMFSFNGGPGSASVWLHMGALGPKRVKMLDDGLMPPPPYQLEDNEQTWLTDTDLVFIDPVGTGYSRATKPEFAQKFFGLQGDLESVGEFIRLYLGRYERWNAPLFLVGESYGTTRASGLSNLLFEKGIGLNGILLISTVMNFQTLRFAEGNDMPLILIFPSYASTAWYHKRLSPELQAKPLKQVLAEAENFASGEYTSALLKGDRLTAAERQSVIDDFSKYSGLSRTFVEQNNLRVELDEFMKELMRDKHLVAGRLDSRFTGYDRSAAGEGTEFDPSMTAIRPPYTATFNDYVRRELGFKSDLEYFILGGGITSPWNYGISNGYADTSVALNSAMRKNPYMKIFVGCGYYDMATPYYAAEYTIAAMNLEPSLRKNISINYYEAGHMMYIEKNSLRKLKEDAARFIQSALTR
jgi:carboxypeptidase C (cathepsin A)